MSDEEVSNASELDPDFEVVMAQLRGRLTPNKAAMVSAIMYAEMAENDDREVERLDRVFGWVCAEIDRIDPSTGSRMMLALTELRKTLDGNGYNVDLSENSEVGE